MAHPLRTSAEGHAEEPAAPPELRDLPCGPDALAFEAVYQRYFDFVWRSARRLGVTEGAIEDLVQEVFVLVHRQLPGFEGRSQLRTWIYGVVLRVVREHRRQAFRSSARQVAYATQVRYAKPNDDALPDEQLAQVQAAQILEEVLEELPPDRREVFVMAELEQMTIPEIAALLGDKLNTVYSRLRLAREGFERSVARRRARDGWRT